MYLKERVNLDSIMVLQNSNSSRSKNDASISIIYASPKINVRGLGLIRLDTDGGLTETGELRFFSGSGVTTVISDQTGFTFQLNGTFTTATFTNIDLVW